MKRLVSNFICLCFAIMLGVVLAPPLVSHAAEAIPKSVTTLLSEEPTDGAVLTEEPQSKAGENEEGTEETAAEPIEPGTGTETTGEDIQQDGETPTDEGQAEAGQNETGQTEQTIQVVDEREWTDEAETKGEAIAEFSEFDNNGDYVLTIKDSEGEEIRSKIDEEKINYSNIKTYDITMVNRDTGEKIATDFGTCDILLPVEKDSVDFETSEVNMMSVGEDGALKPVIKTVGLTGTDGSKYILFTTDHFSEYALLFSLKNSGGNTQPQPQPEPQPENPTPDNDNNGQNVQPITDNTNTNNTAINNNNTSNTNTGSRTQKSNNETANRGTTKTTTETKNTVNETENKNTVDNTKTETVNSEAENTETQVTVTVTTENSETADDSLSVITEETEEVAMLNSDSTEGLISDAGSLPAVNGAVKEENNTSSSHSGNLFSIVFPIMMTLIILVMFFSILKQLEKMEEEDKKERLGSR